MWQRFGRWLLDTFFPQETGERIEKNLHYWEEVNNQLDDELEAAINREVHSTIILPEEVKRLQLQKKELLADLSTLKKQREQLVHEIKEHGILTTDQLMAEKERMRKELSVVRFPQSVCVTSTGYGSQSNLAQALPGLRDEQEYHSQAYRSYYPFYGITKRPDESQADEEPTEEDLLSILWDHEELWDHEASS